MLCVVTFPFMLISSNHVLVKHISLYTYVTRSLVMCIYNWFQKWNEYVERGCLIEVLESVSAGNYMFQ